MRKAWKIMMRAVRDITENPLAALQITVLPIIILILVGEYWLGRAAAAQVGFFGYGGRFVWWMWALGAAGIVLPLLWMAVGWHRLVLLGERPLPVMPRLHPGRMAGYAGRSVQVFLVSLIVTLVAAILLGALGGGVLAMAGYPGGQVGTWLNRIGTPVATFVFTFTFLLFSPALVSTACGVRTTLSQAFSVGDRMTVPIFWLTLASFGMVWLFERIVSVMGQNGIVLGGYVLVSSWFIALYNIGILTALAAEDRWGMRNYPQAGPGDPGGPPP